MFATPVRKRPVEVVRVVRKAPASPLRETPKTAAPIVLEFAGARLVVSADSDEAGLAIALRALGAVR